MPQILLLFITIFITSITNLSSSQTDIEYADSANRRQVLEFDKPHIYVCYMEMKRGFSKPKLGTGFLIHPRVLLTAGHNLAYYPSGRVKNLKGYFGSINDSTYRANFDLDLKRGKNKFFNPLYWIGAKTGSYGLPRDFAIVILPDSSVYKEIEGNFNISVLTSDSLIARADSITITGSPMDKDKFTLWTETHGKYDVTEEKLSSCLYTKPRNSGSPIWYEFEGDFYVAGVHSRGDKKTRCGSAVLINEKVYRKIKKWCLRADIEL